VQIHHVCFRKSSYMVNWSFKAATSADLSHGPRMETSFKTLYCNSQCAISRHASHLLNFTDTSHDLRNRCNRCKNLFPIMLSPSRKRSRHVALEGTDVSTVSPSPGPAAAYNQRVLRRLHLAIEKDPECDLTTKVPKGYLESLLKKKSSQTTGQSVPNSMSRAFEYAHSILLMNS